MKIIEIDGKYINPEHVTVIQDASTWAGYDTSAMTVVIMVSGCTIYVRLPPAEVAELLGLA